MWIVRCVDYKKKNSQLCSKKIFSLAIQLNNSCKENESTVVASSTRSVSWAQRNKRRVKKIKKGRERHVMLNVQE